MNWEYERTKKVIERYKEKIVLRWLRTRKEAIVFAVASLSLTYFLLAWFFLSYSLSLLPVHQNLAKHFLFVINLMWRREEYYKKREGQKWQKEMWRKECKEWEILMEREILIGRDVDFSLEVENLV